MAAESNTVYGVINDAMHDAGLLQEGEMPNSEHLATNMRRLVDIINLWQTQGLKLFLLQDIEINLVANQGAYVLGPTGDVVMERPTQIIQGYVLNPEGIRRPLVPMAWQEWMNLSQVQGNEGTISSYFVDKQATFDRVHFWPTPNASEAVNTAHLLVRTKAIAPINLLQDTMFPQEWRVALRWGLADDICTGQPLAIMERCEQRAVQFRQALEDFDVEDVSMQFTVDPRNDYGTGGFI